MELMRVLGPFQHAARILAWSPDDRKLAFCDRTSTSVMDIDDADSRKTWRSNRVPCLTWRYDGQAIADGEASLGKEGRVLIRPSGTEPVIRVMAEGDDGQLVLRRPEGPGQREDPLGRPGG